MTFAKFREWYSPSRRGEVQCPTSLVVLFNTSWVCACSLLTILWSASRPSTANHHKVSHCSSWSGSFPKRSEALSKHADPQSPWKANFWPLCCQTPVAERRWRGQPSLHDSLRATTNKTRIHDVLQESIQRPHWARIEAREVSSSLWWASQSKGGKGSKASSKKRKEDLDLTRNNRNCHYKLSHYASALGRSTSQSSTTKFCGIFVVLTTNTTNHNFVPQNHNFNYNFLKKIVISIYKNISYNIKSILYITRFSGCSSSTEEDLDHGEHQPFSMGDRLEDIRENKEVRGGQNQNELIGTCEQEDDDDPAHD